MVKDAVDIWDIISNAGVFTALILLGGLILLFSWGVRISPGGINRRGARNNWMITIGFVFIIVAVVGPVSLFITALLLSIPTTGAASTPTAMITTGSMGISNIVMETPTPKLIPTETQVTTITNTLSPTLTPTEVASLTATWTPSPTVTPTKVVRTDDLITRLEKMGILLAGDQASQEIVAGYLKGDASYQTLAKNLITELEGYRLKNAGHLDLINGEFINLIAPGANHLPKEYYEDSDKIKQAVVNAYNLNFPAVTTFDQLLIPDNLTDIQEASGYGMELLTDTGPRVFTQDQTEQVVDVQRYILQGKNYVKVTYNANGYIMGDGNDSSLAFDQPFAQAAHFASLSNYGENGKDGEQTVYIPLADFNQGGGSLALNDPVGLFHARIAVDSSSTIQITSIVVFYFAH